MNARRGIPWRLGLALTLMAAGAGAQPAEEPLPPEPPAVEETPSAQPGRPREIVRIGADYTVAAGETVEEVVVIFGTATIEGHVEGDVVVVLGAARLGTTAVVDGDFVVVGGAATIDPGAVVGLELVVVGGTLDAPPEFSSGGEQVVIGPIGGGERVAAVLPWVTRGLLWGRPIVPGVPWVWAVAGVFALVYLLCNLVFPAPVAASAQTLAAKPLTTGLVGLLVLLLVGPVSFLLAVSVVGLVVVPFLFCALLIAALLGKAGVARWIGSRVVPEASPESRLQSSRSVAVGLLVICLAYMVPIIGLVTWTVLGAVGMGAATLTWIAALRHENPTLPRTPASPLMPPGLPGEPPVPAVPGPPGASQVESAPAGNTRPAADGAGADLSLFPRASFGSRLAAFVLDALLVLPIFGLLDFDEAGAFFLLLLAYHIVFWGWKGTTVGGIICELRVVRADGTAVRFTEALVRGLASVFSFAVVGLGCFWILRDPERQAWHDKIAGTLVVKVPKHWPLA